jgi:hypothetical protein
MAITIDLSNITVDTTAETGTIVDATVYTSPSRATCGVFVKVYKVDHAGNKTYLTTTGNNADEETDTQWEFDYDTDGWHQILYVAVPDFAVAAYNQYDAVFRPSSNAVYRAKTNTSITTETDLDNTTNWEVISDPTALCLNVGAANESDNLTALTSITTLNTVLYPITKENFGTKTGEAFLEASSTYRRSEDVRLYELLGLAVDGMNIANNRQEYSLGEIIARRAISLCSSC